MKKNVKFSKRTTALIVAAVLLFAGGGVAGTRAALNIQSEYYRAQFYLNHLQIHLLENGEDVCGGENDLNGKAKVTGRLATSLEYEDENNLGTVEPGKVYREEIAAKNTSDIDEFVRLTIKKYWVKTEEGKVVMKNGEPEKADQMDPNWIHLMYDGEETFNSSAWMKNSAEETAESCTYYYKTDLNGGADTAPLFDQIKIDGKVAEIGKTIPEETVAADGTKKTVYTYEYKYDGCAFFIEADVQSIQTHNINDAIKSQWGVQNVTGNYSDRTESGSLKVGN